MVYSIARSSFHLANSSTGAVYGCKVRFPHALVMVFLFKSGTFRQKILGVLKATRIHATNLAVFAFIYKSCMKALSHMPHNERGQKHGSLDPFFAGLVGGYFVFGKGIQSSVNQQIVTYIFARVVLALAKLSVEEGGIIPVKSREGVANNAWAVFAAVSWASVMWLHTYNSEALQPSLKSSMNYM